MSRSLIRVAALALLVGAAYAPAHAQQDGDLEQNLQQQLRKRQTGEIVDPVPEFLPKEAPPIIEGLPEEPQPNGGKKRRQREPEPEVTGPGPEDEIVPRRRQRAPEIAEPGPDDEELPRRRRREAEVIAPAPGPELAGPSADQIERQLDAEPRMRMRRSERVTIREFERRPDLRRAAPSIDIQAINFATGSAEIPISQYRKVENIATALDRLLRRDPETLVLIEGHTDAVGSFASNQVLSQRRAASLKRVLVREFDVPPQALETVGYGEEYLLVPTSGESWRNRRVTLRSIDDFVQ